MSRLDSAIRRLEAQRLCLARAASLIDGMAGHVLELGLGNGRTFDHLRELLPARDIYCFDRRLAAHPACVPDREHMFLGELDATLVEAAARLGAGAILVHVDVGSGDKAASLALGARLAGALPPLVAPRAVIVSDQPLPCDAWRESAPPEGVRRGRYFMYRA